MDRNAHKNKSAAIFTVKSHGDVRQDKNAPVRALSGSREPAAVERAAYGQGETAGKPKHHGSNKRRTVEIFTCVSQETFAIIEALRNQGGKHLSRSAVAAAFLEKALQSNTDLQYGALLQPVIEQAIDKRLRSRDARFAGLLVRIAYDAAQNRALLTNLLARSPGLSPEALNAILDQSGKRAKAKLAHLSPEISELIEIVETWMRDTPEEGSRNPS
jgi:hypothetical protein